MLMIEDRGSEVQLLARIEASIIFVMQSLLVTLALFLVVSFAALSELEVI